MRSIATNDGGADGGHPSALVWYEQPMGTSQRRPVAIRDRVITVLARMLSHGFFRTVEAEGPDLPGGPVILAASHLNGFVDPVILVTRLGTFPRFLAKATLWDVPGARPLLGFARVIPVRRTQDSVDPVDNAGTFSAAVEALRDGGVVAVFPEGTTHDDPTIRPLRTGVARIALQAAAEGVEGLHIVPVGVTYEDKVAVRGRALVSFGTAIPVEARTGAVADDRVGRPDHERVRALTGRLQASLEALTPNFASTEEELALTAAARTALRPDIGSGPVPMVRIAAAARQLARADRQPVERLVALVARYQMLLGFIGLDDDEMGGDVRVRTLVRRLVVLGVLVVLLAPLAVAGLFVNLIPVALVLVAGLIPDAPVTKGTVRLLVALVAFPATWTLIALRDGTTGWLAETARQVTYPLDPLFGPAPADRGGTLPNLAVFIAAPVLAAVALLVVERLGAFLRNLVTWRTLVDRRGQLSLVRERRAEVVAATAELLSADAGGGSGGGGRTGDAPAPAAELLGGDRA
jgi:1-acyl-sn-glycerol-3-phosphate acyltransferase